VPSGNITYSLEYCQTVQMSVVFDEQWSIWHRWHRCFCHSKIFIYPFMYLFIPICKVICCLEVLKMTEQGKEANWGFNSARVQHKVIWGLRWTVHLFYKVILSKLSFLLSFKTHQSFEYFRSSRKMHSFC